MAGDPQQEVEQARSEDDQDRLRSRALRCSVSRWRQRRQYRRPVARQCSDRFQRCRHHRRHPLVGRRRLEAAVGKRRHQARCNDRPSTMATAHDPGRLPPGLPVPQDDGAGDVIGRRRLPCLRSPPRTVRKSISRLSGAARSFTSFLGQVDRARIRPMVGMRFQAHAVARRNPARSATISPISGTRVLRISSAFRRKTPTISAKRSSACICRFRCFPTGTSRWPRRSSFPSSRWRA